MGSPFTARLCTLLGERLTDASAVGRGVLGWPGDPGADGLALRLVGGLHALVLMGEAPELAEVYPGGGRAVDAGSDAGSNAGPDARPDVGPGWGPDRGDAAALWPAVEEALTQQERFLLAFIESPPQTNEVARSGVLFGGFQTVAAETGLPLNILELGASAGLNLLWDHYRYGLGELEWGPEDAPLRLDPEWSGPLPPLGALTVSGRAGCDQRPIDPLDEEARLRLRAYVWADQFDRRQRLEAALDHFAKSGLEIDQADAADWAEVRLVRLLPGATTVLFHSIFWHYLEPDIEERIRSAIDEAAAQATLDAPFAWLRMEVHESRQFAGLYLNLWPGALNGPAGETRLLAEADFHGAWVRWL